MRLTRTGSAFLFAIISCAPSACCRHEREFSGDPWVEPAFSCDGIRERGDRVKTSLDLGEKELWIVNPFDSHPASWRFYMLVDGRTIRIESVNDLLAYAGGIQTEADALEFVRILTLVDNLGPLWIAGLPGRKLMSWEADRTHELCGVDACVIDAKSVNGQIVVERFVGSCGEPDQVIRVREFLSANKYRWELVNLLTEEVHLLRFR